MQFSIERVAALGALDVLSELEPGCARGNQWRFGLHSPSTSPVVSFSAANRFVVPCRT